ncbi:AbiJ-NTD4 domain-containing protein [Alloyangia pacifica]|uniref:AbiJ-NTD4 domain-containing protein n=1 Tax=Alloyangia pacifica TaxID=311180 RepID=UPI0031DCB393
MSDDSYVPFSQRSGLVPKPPQLELGEISPELRRYLDYSAQLEIDRFERQGYENAYFDDRWNRVAQDLHVLFLGQRAGTYKNSPYNFRKQVEKAFLSAPLGTVFDLVEFFMRHSGCSREFKRDLVDCFPRARAAYRIIDEVIVAIGTGQQAAAFEAQLVRRRHSALWLHGNT